MSLTLGLPTTGAARLVTDPADRTSLGRRVITPQLSTSSCLVFATDPTGLAAEQYRILRHRLCTLRPQGGAMLITSPGPGEGKTLTSANLAWCLAEAGHLTCLVDLDFRAPGLTRALGVSVQEDGVEDVLTGKRTASQALRQINDLPLHVLAIKKRRAAIGGLLSASSIAPLLAELRLIFQWVILDFAPAIPMADVSEALPYVDGALLVIRSGKTTKTMISPALEILRFKLTGTVVNDSVISGSEYYGDYGKKGG